MRDGQLSQRAQEIVSAARQLLEEEGIDGLSMRRLATRLGIQAPSIYKHLPDKQALENALISDGFEQRATSFCAALEDAEDPVGALGAAYRAFAHGHPHFYRRPPHHQHRGERTAESSTKRARRSTIPLDRHGERCSAPGCSRAA